MKYIVLAALGAAVTGFLLGWVICRRGLDGISRAQAASVTRQLFVVTLWACIAWISCSYAMAIYSMVILGQVYTLTELSEPALKALTVTLGGKVLSNMVRNLAELRNPVGVFFESECIFSLNEDSNCSIGKPILSSGPMVDSSKTKEIRCSYLI